MKFGKKLKRDTLIIAISVLVLTLTTIRVSYAAFFEVRSQSTVQKLETGELKVLIDNNSSKSISLNELFPTATSELPTPEKPSISSTDGSYASLTLINDGDYDSEFAISIGPDSLPEGKKASDLIDFRFLNIGIYDKTHTSWINFGNTDSPKYYIAINNLVASDDGLYPILNSTLNTGASVNYDIYVWLSEDTPVEEIGQLVYLKLTIVSATLNDGSDRVS